MAFEERMRCVLSEDLIRYIYSFGSPDVYHAKKRASLEINNNIEKAISIYNAFYSPCQWVPKRERQWFFMVLKNCPCCVRHSQRRPNRVDEVYIDSPYQGYRQSPCPCECRIILRALGRW